MFGHKKQSKGSSGSSAQPAKSRLDRWWQGMAPGWKKLIVRSYVMLLTVTILGGGAYLVYVKTDLLQKVQAQVVKAPPAPVPTKMLVMFSQMPDWMPASLQQQITTSITPTDVKASDPQLAAKVLQLASANPWISKVAHAVTRPSTDPKLLVVEVQAEFRVVAAKVATHAGVEYVSHDGCRMPAEQVPQCFVDAPATASKPSFRVYFLEHAEVPRGWPIHDIHYITIEGVAQAAPAMGQQWKGDDLADALRMLRIVSTRKYANQISTIEVRNYSGGSARDPRIAMRARVGDGLETIIRFGRFPNPDGDWEIPTERKMQYLDTFVSDNDGKLAGTAKYVELRYDQLRYQPL